MTNQGRTRIGSSSLRPSLSNRPHVRTHPIPAQPEQTAILHFVIDRFRDHLAFKGELGLDIAGTLMCRTGCIKLDITFKDSCEIQNEAVIGSPITQS